MWKLYQTVCVNDKFMLSLQRAEAYSSCKETVTTLADGINGIIIFQPPSNYQKWSFVNSFLMGPPVTLQSLCIMAFHFWNQVPGITLPNVSNQVPDSLLSCYVWYIETFSGGFLPSTQYMIVCVQSACGRYKKPQQNQVSRHNCLLIGNPDAETSVWGWVGLL